MPDIDTYNACYFRDEFRNARAIALKDAEGFQQIVFALEKLGAFLCGDEGGLGKYEAKIRELAAFSPLMFDCGNSHHSDFKNLYKLVRTGRNDALHQGAIARHLTDSAIRLALIMEDAIERKAKFMKVSDYMIRNPVCAYLWQPLSFIRQQILINSFSFIPFEYEGNWCFVSDYELSRYLRSGDRKDRLAHSLEKAIREKAPDHLKTEKAETVKHDAVIGRVLDKFKNKPLLVFEDENEKNLLGIITAFDIL